MVTGFGPEAVIYSLGGSFRGSLRLLIDNIINGRIRGIAGILAVPMALVRTLIRRLHWLKN